MFEANGIEVLLLPHVIDTQFAQLVESKKEGVKFLRVDSELADSMKGEGAEDIPAALDIFKAIVPEATEIKFEALKDESLPAVLNVSEDSRRMEDLMRMYSAMGENAPALPANATLILNSASPVIKGLDTKDEEKAALVAKQIYSLCMLTQGRLNADSLKEFLSDSYSLLSMI